MSNQPEQLQGPDVFAGVLSHIQFHDKLAAATQAEAVDMLVRTARQSRMWAGRAEACAERLKELQAGADTTVLPVDGSKEMGQD